MDPMRCDRTNPHLRHAWTHLGDQVQCPGVTGAKGPEAKDPVNPSHYKDVVPGIECIQVTQHFNFCRGNAIKYLWRAGAKGSIKEDLQKAIWYIQRELDSL